MKNKKKILFTLIILLITRISMASEYYALILGVDKTEKTMMKRTCREFPLNTYMDIMSTKSTLLEKYVSKEKLDYLKMEITHDDTFYKEEKMTSLIKRDCLREPELLKTYLTNLWYYVVTNKQAMIDDKIFVDTREIDNFLEPVLTLIGIMGVATEINCKKVTWVTMKY